MSNSIFRFFHLIYKKVVERSGANTIIGKATTGITSTNAVVKQTLEMACGDICI